MRQNMIKQLYDTPVMKKKETTATQTKVPKGFLVAVMLHNLSVRRAASLMSTDIVLMMI